MQLPWAPARTLPATGFLVGITVVFVIAMVSLIAAVLLTVLLLRNRCASVVGLPRPLVLSVTSTWHAAGATGMLTAGNACKRNARSCSGHSCGSA